MVLDAVLRVSFPECSQRRKQGVRVVECVDDDGERPRQLPTLCGHVDASEERGGGRVDLEQSIVEARRERVGTAGDVGPLARTRVICWSVTRGSVVRERPASHEHRLSAGRVGVGRFVECEVVATGRTIRSRHRVQTNRPSLSVSPCHETLCVSHADRTARQVGLWWTQR